MEVALWEVVVAVTKERLIPIGISILSLFSSFAEMMQKGSTKIKTVFNIFHQNSDSGEQVFDNSKREEVNVVEPMIFLEHQISEDTAIDAHFVYDLWTAASDTKLDASTGASGEGIKGQSRIAANIGVRTEGEVYDYGLTLGFSSEYDYRSFNVSTNISRSFAKDNFTVGLSASYYHDSVSLFKDLSPPENANIEEMLSRQIVATSLTMSQILTQKDIALFDFTFARASKNLESTASTTVVNGQRELENLPDSRSRYASSLKWVHGVGETMALHTSYRYYFDQWNLSAHTVKLSLFKEYNDDEDYIELYGRFHNQSAVEYYGDSFTDETFRTSDSDLSKFSSYEVGAFMTNSLDDSELYGFDLEDMSVNYSLVTAKRDTGLTYTYFQTSFQVVF